MEKRSETIEMDISQLMDYIREHPAEIIHITVEDEKDERSQD